VNMIDLKNIEELKKSGAPAVVATVIKSSGSTPRSAGASMIVFADGAASGTVGGGALEKLVKEHALKIIKKGVSKTVSFDLKSGAPDEKRVRTGMICGGKADVFFDVYKPAVKLFICGAGHIGFALSKFADILKWDATLIDNREGFVKINKLKNVLAVPSYKKAFEKIEIDGRSAVVIVTHGHKYDAVCLDEAIGTKAFYIGMIGSKIKVGQTYKALRAKGVKIDGRVYSPVGLELGGQSPEEISFCIIAEIMKVRNKVSGRHLRIKS